MNAFSPLLVAPERTIPPASFVIERLPFTNLETCEKLERVDPFTVVRDSVIPKHSA